MTSMPYMHAGCCTAAQMCLRALWCLCCLVVPSGFLRFFWQVSFLAKTYQYLFCFFHLLHCFGRCPCPCLDIPYYSPSFLVHATHASLPLVPPPSALLLRCMERMLLQHTSLSPTLSSHASMPRRTLAACCCHLRRCRYVDALKWGLRVGRYCPGY